jgi:hypothetical protein
MINGQDEISKLLLSHGAKYKDLEIILSKAILLHNLYHVRSSIRVDWIWVEKLLAGEFLAKLQELSIISKVCLWCGDLGHMDLFEMLLNSQDPIITKNILTAVARSAYKGHIEIVKLSLDSNYNSIINQCNIILKNAIYGAKPKIVKLLLTHEKTSLILHNKINDLFILALEHHHFSYDKTAPKEIIKLFLCYDIKLEDTPNKFSLIRWLWWHNLDVIKDLLEQDEHVKIAKKLSDSGHPYEPTLTAKMANKFKVFLMGTHDKLGKDSLISNLSEDILWLISQEYNQLNHDITVLDQMFLAGDL